MDLPLETSFHAYIVGITSDDLKVWRRVSDGVEVTLSGWWPGDPVDKSGYTILRWYYGHDSPNKNDIYNAFDWRALFICEF